MNVVAVCAILREAVAGACSRLVPTMLCILVVAAGTATVFLTTGRAVGSQRAVLDTLDEAGTRSIVVQAPVSAGLDSTFLERMTGLDDIDWAGAFGPAFDVRNTSLPGGTPVAARTVWTSDFSRLGLRPTPGYPAAWATRPALAALGLLDAAGTVSRDRGTEIGVAGTWIAPDFLDLLGPTVLLPADRSRPGPITVAVIVAERPDQVADLARTIGLLISAPDPGAVTVKTSAELAALRSAVDGRLGEFGAQLLIMTFTATAILNATMLAGLVLMRRKDFGRRRALGATRTFIGALLMVQTALTASVGVLLGTAVSSVSSAIEGAPGPDVRFMFGVCILMVAIAVAASLPPAVVAAHREPVRELRVP